jgi:hypothetical protein
MANFLRNCGVTIINIGRVNFTRKADAFLLRNTFLFDFLRARTPLFDRIIVTDLSDTIFQGDPFSEAFDRRAIGFSMESRPCDRGHLSQTSLILGRRRAWGMHKEGNCVNPGTMVGSERTILAFLEKWNGFVSGIQPGTLARLSYVPDQVILNAVIRTNVVAGLKLRFFHGFQEYVAMWKWFGKENVTYRIGDFRVWAAAPFPVVVHMYDRGRNFCASVSEVCRATFPTHDQYTRCFSPGW